MIKYCKWIITFSLSLVVNYVYANCDRTSLPTSQLNINLGQVVVSPNLGIMQEITRRELLIDNKGDEIFIYCDQGTVLSADVVNLQPTSNPKIFQTNIPGIGIGFEYDGVIYPGEFVLPTAGWQGYYLDQLYYTVILYKIAEFTGSGAIDSGLYTTYGYRPNNNPMLDAYIPANGITIVSPSCLVVGGNSQNVYLPPISRLELTGQGTTAGDTPFSIQLKCNGGASVNSGFDNINLTFNGDIPSGLNNNQGVLVNKSTTSSAASGVGIQVLDSSNQPLVFNQKYTVGTLATPQNGYSIIQNYTARYYQYGDKISAGQVESKMLFNITYD